MVGTSFAVGNVFRSVWLLAGAARRGSSPATLSRNTRVNRARIDRTCQYPHYTAVSHTIRPNQKRCNSARCDGSCLWFFCQLNLLSRRATLLEVRCGLWFRGGSNLTTQLGLHRFNSTFSTTMLDTVVNTSGVNGQHGVEFHFMSREL